MSIELKTEELKRYILERQKTGARTLIAIDGRCGSGKTTLAAELMEAAGCTVIHMDYFYLRAEQRTPERLDEPGGNVDRERFLEEVLGPLKDGAEIISYHVFDHTIMDLREQVTVVPDTVVVIEGSYSMHPDLTEYYDLRVFLTIPEDVQRARIIAREGEEKAEMFFKRWIPMEEKYFSHFKIEEKADVVITGFEV